jgi:hypothetical protein
MQTQFFFEPALTAVQVRAIERERRERLAASGDPHHRREIIRAEMELSLRALANSLIKLDRLEGETGGELFASSEVSVDEFISLARGKSILVPANTPACSP